jgi:hypothetical protein
MLSRTLAILLAPCLPTAALILNLGPAHTTNALIAGCLVTVLSAFALVSRRAGVAASVVAGWVALFGLIYPSTLLESVLALSWGTTMFALMAGPFSEAPRVERAASIPTTPRVSAETERALPLAA